MGGTGWGEPELEVLGMLEGRRDVGRSSCGEQGRDSKGSSSRHFRSRHDLSSKESGILGTQKAGKSGLEKVRNGWNRWESLRWKLWECWQEGGAAPGAQEQMAFPWITLYHQGYLKELPKRSSRALENRVFQE